MSQVPGIRPSFDQQSRAVATKSCPDLLLIRQRISSDREWAYRGESSKGPKDGQQSWSSGRFPADISCADNTTRAGKSEASRIQYSYDLPHCFCPARACRV